MNIGIAYPAFFESFQYFIPELKIIGGRDRQTSNIKVEDCDLVIFSGGEDISPDIYGEENRYSSFNVKRDLIELRILWDCLSLGKKILGVCRGHQLINAYLGGKITQDISRELKKFHSGNHTLDILEDTFTTKHFSKWVNSMHHQGVIEPGKGMVPTSFYEGVYESTESDLGIITVQWHPEFLSSQKFFDQIINWVQEK